MKLIHIWMAVLLILALLACPLAMAEETAPGTEGLYITQISDEIFERMQGKSFKDDCTLPLADDVTFTDGWDIEKEPVTVTGAEAVAEAIAGTEMDAFIPQNTTVRVEDGKIVEIIREYMP